MPVERMRRAATLWATAIVVAVSTMPARADDKFGQDYPPQVVQRVLDARDLRSPRGKAPMIAQRDAELAARALREVTDAHPRYFRAWFNLGLALNAAFDYKGAKVAFARAIALRDELNIRDVTVLNSAGWAAVNNGDHATAEALLKRALEDIELGSPYTQASIHYNLAKTYFLTNRPALAKDHADRAVAIDSSPEAEVLRRLLDRSASISRKRKL